MESLLYQNSFISWRLSRRNYQLSDELALYPTIFFGILHERPNKEKRILVRPIVRAKSVEKNSGIDRSIKLCCTLTSYKADVQFKVLLILNRLS